MLSPQGDKLAFVAHSGDSKLLWVRSLNSDFAKQLDGTSGAAHPFWSPGWSLPRLFRGWQADEDSRRWRSGCHSCRCSQSSGRHLGRGDVIVFAADYTGGLMKVNAQGGTAEPATALDRTKHSTHRWPWFLPDGKHFLFLATNHTGGDPQTERNLFRVSGQQGNPADRCHAESAAQYASGYLLYRPATG